MGREVNQVKVSKENAQKYIVASFMIGLGISVILLKHFNWELYKKIIRIKKKESSTLDEYIKKNEIIRKILDCTYFLAW